MTIAFGAIGAKSTGGTTTTNVAHPASIGAGDFLLLADVGWPSSAGVNAISGWAVTQSAGGTGTAVDSHTTTLAVFRKEAIGTESGSVSVSRGGTPTGQLGIMARYTKTAAAWDTAATAIGTDSAHGANRSATTGTIDLAPGDMVTIAVAVDTDAALTITSPTLTATGITFGTINRRTSGAGDAVGEDGNVELFDALVTAGSGTVAVTFAFTTATSQCGPILITRLREVASSNFTGSAALSGDGSLSATGTPAPAATADLSGSGTLTTAATPTASGQAVLSGSGSLTATAAPNLPGAASLAGAGALTTTGAPSATGATSLSGSGTLTAGTGGFNGTAALSGTGALIVAGTPGPVASVAFSGSGTLTTAGTPRATGTASLGGSGQLVTAGRTSAAGGPGLSGDGTLQAVTLPALAALAQLEGEGTLVATGSTAPLRDLDLRAVLHGDRYTAATEPDRYAATVDGAARYGATTQPDRYEAIVSPDRYEGALT